MNIIASNNIRGINIVFGAETTALTAALADVNRRSRDLNGELSQVQRLLRMDPGNIQLISQQQRLLGEAVENSREKLNRLRAAQEQVNQQFARGEISEEQYRAFQREVVAAEQQLRRFEDRARQASQSVNSLGNRMAAAGDKVAGFGKKMTLGVTAAATGIIAATTGKTQELGQAYAALDTAATHAGESVDVVREHMETLAAVSDDTGANAEALGELLASGFKDEQLTELLDSVSGAAIKFKETMKMEGIADGLQETLATGAAIGPFAELLERSGINLDDFNAGLQESIKNGAQQQYVLDVLAKTGLKDVNEEYRNSNKALVDNKESAERYNQAMSDLGVALLPAITAITDAVSKLADMFNSLTDEQKKMALWAGGIVLALGPVITIIGNVMQVGKLLSGMFGAGGMIAKAFLFITGPIGLIVLAIAAIGLIVYEVIKNWDVIKAKATEIWDGIKNYFSETWESITSACSEAWDRFKADITETWNSVKDFFKKWGDEILLIAIGPAGWAVLLGRELAKNWDSIKQTALNIWNNIKTGISDIWGNIKSTAIGAATDLYNSVKSKLENLWSYIKGIPGQARQWGREIIQKLIDGIKSLKIPMPHFDFDIDYKSVAGVRFPVPDVDVRWYKEGGIFNRPTIAGIGDVPEAVLPLSELPSMMTEALIGAIGSLSSSSVTTNVNGGNTLTNTNNHFLFSGPVNIRNDQDIERMAQRLYQLQQNKLRGQGI